jgi:hypothetical protein
MATYLEIWGLFNDSTLNSKVGSACIIAADSIRTEAGTVANHVNRLKWAKRVWADPVSIAAEMLKAVLAANNSLTLAQITGASDAAIQTAVNNAIDIFADGT